MIKLGSIDMSKAYVGSTEVSKMYLGSDLVYSKGPEVLPYDAEIEYLESSGTEYIDTGLYGDIELDYEIVAQITGSNQYHNILGDRYSSSSRRYSLMYDRKSNTTGGYFNCGNSNQITLPKSYRTSNYLTYKKDGLQIYINNDSIGSFSEQTFTTPNTIIIFGCRNNGTLQNSLVGRISSCSFSKNGIKILDLIPVRVGQVGYMYDKVSKQLFGNASESGAFILGNDI